jgi:hypothetical protein
VSEDFCCCFFHERRFATSKSINGIILVTDINDFQRSFIADINITGDQYDTGFRDIGDHSLSPVSLTTAS